MREAGKKVKNESKMKNEKRIMNISLIGSILFMLSEGIMAYLTKSHSLLMDCIFDVTDRSLSAAGPSSLQTRHRKKTLWIFPGGISFCSN